MNAVINPRGVDAATPQAVENLLHYVALLAGLGPNVQVVVGEQAGVRHAPAGAGRTCIDGGSRLLFSLVAPGERSLRLLTRCPQVEAGVLPWQRTYYRPSGSIERWYSETYLGEPPSAWSHIASAVDRIGGGATLRQMHGILGPRSQLYAVNWSLDAATPRVWVGWQLDRTFPISETLAALGYHSAWPTVAAVWQALSGLVPSPRSGPWSISLGFGGDDARLRLGSTKWARQLEDDEKRRRLATLLAHFGGDRRFAEALYKLVVAATPPGRPRAIGRAVEVELVGDQVDQIEVYLCLPSFYGKSVSV